MSLASGAWVAGAPWLAILILVRARVGWSKVWLSRWRRRQRPAGARRCASAGARRSMCLVYVEGYGCGGRGWLYFLCEITMVRNGRV